VNFRWLNPLQLHEGQNRDCLTRAAAYLSPETNKTGTLLCTSDVWSAGAILLVILHGCLPCLETLHQQLGALACKEARDLLAGILVVNPNERTSAAQALEYHWLASDCTGTQTAQQVSNFREALVPFVSFYTRDRMQAAAFTNMDCQVACRQIEALREQFEPIGAIPQDELLRAMRLAPVACVPNAGSWVHQIWEEEQGGTGIAEMQPATWEAAALKFVSDLSNEATQIAFGVLDDDASGTVSSEKVSRMLSISHGELGTHVALGGGLFVDGVLDYNGFRAAVAGYAAWARLQAETPSRTHGPERSSSSSDTYNVCSPQMLSEAGACHEDFAEGPPDAKAGASLASSLASDPESLCMYFDVASDDGRKSAHSSNDGDRVAEAAATGTEQRRRCVSFHEPAEVVLVPMPTPEEKHFVQKFVALCVGQAVAG